MRLDGKVAIVSGGASGIGAACARRFAEEGAKVVVGDIDTANGNQVVKEINEQHHDAALFCDLDVTIPADWQTTVTAAVETFGKLDTMVACAGICSMAGLLDEDQATWDRVIAINQTGTWLGMRAAVPAMRQAGGGSIILTSSIWGKVGSAGATVYQATKGAVVLLGKAVAAEFVADGIRANVICPGIIDTPFLNVLNDEQRAGITAMSLMQRAGLPTEVASAALFLASDEASYVTGAEFLVDGGYTAV